jgi:hypothetical protein
MSDLENSVRDMIHRETEYRNNRMGWFCTLQGLLFAALGLSAKNGKLPDEFYSVVICLGMASAFLSMCGLAGTTQTINRLLKHWVESKDYDPDALGVIGGAFSNALRSKDFGFPKIALTYLAPWNTLPLCFLIGWVYLLCVL